MADAVTRRYIYPPNWDENVAGSGLLYGEDGVIGAKGSNRYIIHLTNISDGTGETKINKVDISELYCIANGQVAKRTVIEWIEYDVFGMDVTLYWETTAEDVVIARLPGGATAMSGKIRGPLVDPRNGDGTDGSGDILLSTTNAASGDSYDIRMSIRPKPGTRG